MRKSLLRGIILSAIFVFTACGNIQNTENTENIEITESCMFIAENNAYTLGESRYSDFVENGWTTDVSKEDIAVYKVTIEESIHYEYSVSLHKNGTALSEVVFKSEEDALDFDGWILSGVSVVYENNENTEAKMTFPLQFTPHKTADEVYDFLTSTYGTVYKTTNQSTGEYEMGIVNEGIYVGSKYNETGTFISMCVEIDADFNHGRSATRHQMITSSTEETETEPETETRPSFAEVDETQCFTYENITYIVGKTKLGDFMLQGWEMESEYLPDTPVPPKSAYYVKYLTKDNLVLKDVYFVNSNDADHKLMKDCTMISCYIPLSMEIGREYDNSLLTLPHGLLSTMSCQEAIEQLDEVGEIPSSTYEQEDLFMIRMGIVSPYNVDVGFLSDKNTMSHIYIEVNPFYAGYY